MSAIPCELVRFRERFSPRGPLISPEPYECMVLASSFSLLEYAPAQNVAWGDPPRTRRGSGLNRYLWVIDDVGIPFIKEIPIPTLNAQMPKHTNLTGGGPAYIGGELWFESEEHLFVSGSSGRYRPIDAGHLAAAVEVFEAYRYVVTSLGWDADARRPYRYLEQSRE